VRLADVAERRVQDLETLVELRTEALQRSNARLAAANEQLALQTERANNMAAAASAASQATSAFLAVNTGMSSTAT